MKTTSTYQSLSDSFLNFDPNLDIEAIEQEQEATQQFSHLCDSEF